MQTRMSPVNQTGAGPHRDSRKEVREDRAAAKLRAIDAQRHECGYFEDTFACKIRHVQMNSGVAKAADG